jgi:hypothetical protein
MKLVELLARELVEWPKKCSKIWQSSMDLEIYFDGCNHEYTEISEEASDRGYSGSHVTRAQWQAERDRQKGGEWKRHRGGKQPVADGVRVEVKLRCGDIQQYEASAFAWPHTSCDVDANIMQYRIISQPQAEELEYRGPFPCAPIADPENAIEFDIEFPSGACKLEAKVDQIDGPLKWRDTIIHCQAIIEDCEREIQRNVDLLDAEGLYMQLNAKVGMDYAPSISAEDWQVGDILEIVANIGDHNHEFKIGEQVKIAAFDQGDDELPIRCDALDGSDFWYIKHAEAKFIRRP